MEKKSMLWVILYTLMIGMVHILQKSNQVSGYTFLSGMNIQNRRSCQELLNTTKLQAGNLYCTDEKFWVPSNWKQLMILFWNGLINNVIKSYNNT